MRLQFIFAICACGLSLGTAERPAYGQSSISVAEQYLFAAANAERVQRGLPALRWDNALYRAATAHARQMAARESISHQYPGEPELTVRGHQAGAKFTVIAENVAEAPTAVRIHDAWMNSPGHRANLLDARVDAVGIRVEKRNGQLYAVEDFDRAVEELSLEEQERHVAALLQTTARVKVLGTDDARRTCAMETGYAGGRRPGFIMRYTTGDIGQLPSSLKERLATGRYHEAAVGACSSTVQDAGQENFTAFNVAVLLYP